jgi:hypothetical protein
MVQMDAIFPTPFIEREEEGGEDQERKQSSVSRKGENLSVQLCFLNDPRLRILIMTS